MEAIDQYISRLSDPAVRAYNRMLNGFEDGEDGPDDRPQVSEADVASAEGRLGVALPPSYRKLVTAADPRDKEYGFYWVAVEGLDTGGDDIVSANRGSAPIPSFLIAVQGTDGGDEYCLDTRRPDDRGEYPVVHFDHEVHDEESTEFEMVARDLGEFLLGSVHGGRSDS